MFFYSKTIFFNKIYRLKILSLFLYWSAVYLFCLWMLRHIPVLAPEIYDHMPANRTLSFDGTFWHWGHAEYFLSHEARKRSISDLKIIGTDVDSEMIAKAQTLTAHYQDQIAILHNSYALIDQIAQKVWLFDFELLDLGVNLEHFKDGSRGFSIKTDAPLDMRFNQASNTITAHKWLQTVKPEILQSALSTYGDFSPKTAEYLTKLLCEQRKKSDFSTTFQLKDFLLHHHFNQKKIAVIFQVIRIMVNDELAQLELFLQRFPQTLKRGGRCAIITYHSIEDRITKLAFKSLAESWAFQLVNKKVIVPHYTEIQHNKAARSAKLRIIEKVS